MMRLEKSKNGLIIKKAIYGSDDAELPSSDRPDDEQNNTNPSSTYPSSSIRDSSIQVDRGDNGVSLEMKKYSVMSSVDDTEITTSDEKMIRKSIDVTIPLMAMVRRFIKK